MKRLSFLFITLFINLCFLFPARADYYVNSATGSDRNNGSKNAPWASLEKARRSLTGPATVIVEGGNYPVFSENRSPKSSDYLHFKAAPGKKPRLAGINLNYSSLENAYLVFDGFDIYSESLLRLVDLTYVSKFKLLNSVVHADHWSRGPRSGVYGVDIKRSLDITVRKNKFYEVFRGVLIRNSDEVKVSRNFITVKGASAIMYSAGSKDGLIEYNHITGENYTRYPEDPMAFNKPHQSIIAISSNDLVVRGNLMHGIGNSSGMMLYPLDESDREQAYKNILIESNALYNTSNNNAFRIYDLGENVVLRNNLFFAKKRSGPCDGITNDARYRYNVAVNVHNLADGYDGSGLELYNNIFIGAVMIPERARERDNIFWSLRMAGDWQSRSTSNTSKVIVASYLGCGRHPQLMEDGSFFMRKNTLDFPQNSLLDLTLSADSLGRNTVSEKQLPETFLGAVDEDGFLREPVMREQVDQPSAGPMQTPLATEPGSAAIQKVSAGCPADDDCQPVAQ